MLGIKILWSDQNSKRNLLLLALVIVFSSFHYVHSIVKLIVGHLFFPDFAHYYTFATIVNLGLNPFDSNAIAQIDDLLKLERTSAPPVHIPVFYLLMQPWILLPFHIAAVTWLLVNQMFLFLAVFLCLRRLETVSMIVFGTTLFVVFNYFPLLVNFRAGQLNTLLLLLVTIAWWGIRSRLWWITGIAVAMAANIKPQYGLLIPLLWWLRHIYAAMYACLFWGLVLLAGLIVLGIDHYLEFIKLVLSYPENYIFTWFWNLSPRATFHRMFATLDQWAVLAEVLTLCLDLFVLVLFARAIPRGKPPESSVTDWAWGLGLISILLLAPLTEEHDLVVLLCPIMLLILNEQVVAMPTKEVLLLVASIALLGSGYSLGGFSVFHQGPFSLLAAGKLLGTACLAWVILSRLRAPEVIPHAV